MELKKLIFILLVLCNVLLLGNVDRALAQNPTFDLPVELIGFPVIVVAVRLSNFVKKLAYSLNPRTYTGRARRSIEDEDMIDVVEAEKRIVAELGDNVCIYPRICLYYAEKASQNGNNQVPVDWNDIFSHYKSSKEKEKENYLLSIFLGDIVKSKKLCNQLAKRGRACADL